MPSPIQTHTRLIEVAKAASKNENKDAYSFLEHDFANEILRMRNLVSRARCEIMDASHNTDYIIGLLDDVMGAVTGGYGEQGDE